MTNQDSFLNEITDFDIKRIDAKEQESLILSAAENIHFDNSENIKSRNIFEKNGKIIPEKLELFKNRKVIGYCKSSKCKRQHPNNIIHSADYGPYVYYHCIKCLSELLCSARSDSRSPCSLLIQFDPPKNPEENETYIQTRNKEFEIKMEGSKTYLNGEEVTGNLVPLTKEDNSDENDMKWKFVVTSKIVIKTSPNQHGILTGIYRGNLKGRHVCKNIYLGKPCLSLKPDYKPQGFFAKSIPPGVPGWRENHNIGQEGRLIILDYCPGCSHSSENSAKNEIKSPVKNYEKKIVSNNEIDYKKEFENLTRITNDLLDQLDKLQKENSKIRIELENLKIENLRNQLNKIKNN